MKKIILSLLLAIAVASPLKADAIQDLLDDEKYGGVMHDVFIKCQDRIFIDHDKYLRRLDKKNIAACATSLFKAQQQKGCSYMRIAIAGVAKQTGDFNHLWLFINEFHQYKRHC